MLNELLYIYQKQQKKSLLDNYVTTGLQFVTENTALNGGKYLNISYNDMLKPPDTRTGEEIVEEVIAKCGLKEVE